MDVYVAAVELDGGSEHKHISSVICVGEDTLESGMYATADVVKYINDGGTVKVSDGENRIAVRVVKANPSYLRTYADGKLTDNLLSLPKYSSPQD